ncbi:MAG: glycoside hydrolase family 43 protein [bacterium]|nr:glycoside hydrolase family 43 protein [bacterium]
MAILLSAAMLTGAVVSAPPEAYLFAHMTHQDYGRLYYAVSRDGLKWEELNNAKRVTDDYRGHPDICAGHDGRFYLIGNYSTKPPEITIWASDDLVSWERHTEFVPDLNKTPNFSPGFEYKGAPKIYFDAPSKTYVISWHTPSVKESEGGNKGMWESMRTLYVTSTDLKTFSDPKRLFDFELATIDVFIRCIDGTYYAFVKDERWPSLDCPTGKAIRVSVGEGLLGPYAEPGPPISSNFREAPTLIPRPDGEGWYLFVEEYPAISYECFTVRRPEDQWYEVRGPQKSVPPNARHGCMIPISLDRYGALTKAYASDAKAE